MLHRAVPILNSIPKRLPVDIATLLLLGSNSLTQGCTTSIVDALPETSSTSAAEASQPGLGSKDGAENDGKATGENQPDATGSEQGPAGTDKATTSSDPGTSGGDVGDGGKATSGDPGKTDEPDGSQDTKTKPESEKTKPESETTKPESETTKPESETTTPETETSTAEPEPEPEKNLCEEAGYRCVERAPRGWQGPMRLVEAGSVDRLENCRSPERSLRTLFDGLRGEAPQCRGCEFELDLPSCTPAKFQSYSQVGCSSSSKLRVEALSSSCRRVPLDGANDAVPAGRFILPTPSGPAKCEISREARANIPEVRAEGFFRGCEAKKDIKCLSAKNACVEDKNSPVCIYRSGRHQCPSGTSFRSREVVDSGYEDTRSCGECKGKLRDWNPSCNGDIFFYGADDSSCTDFAQGESFDKLRSANECFTASSLGFAGWFHMKVQRPELSHNARCEASGWGPRGNVRGTGPVTFCCQD